MDVQAISFRGFKLVGRGVPQESADKAREEVEAVLEKHGVTAAEIDALADKFRDIGMGVDLQQFTADDWHRYGIDPKHVRANKHIHAALTAALRGAPPQAGRSIFFKAEPTQA